MLVRCYNNLTITGPGRDINRFIRATRGLPAQYPGKKNLPSAGKYFCFNAFMPVPQNILPFGESRQEKRFSEKSGVMMFRRISCGAEWCELNWGAGHDVWDQKIMLQEVPNDRKRRTIQVGFLTYSCEPPIRWLDAVIAKFPNLTFFLHYSLSDQFAYGYVYGHKGETWESEVITEAQTEVFGPGQDILSAQVKYDSADHSVSNEGDYLVRYFCDDTPFEEKSFTDARSALEDAVDWNTEHDADYVEVLREDADGRATLLWLNDAAEGEVELDEADPDYEIAVRYYEKSRQ